MPIMSYREVWNAGDIADNVVVGTLRQTGYFGGCFRIVALLFNVSVGVYSGQVLL